MPTYSPLYGKHETGDGFLSLRLSSCHSFIKIRSCGVRNSSSSVSFTFCFSCSDLQNLALHYISILQIHTIIADSDGFLAGSREIITHEHLSHHAKDTSSYCHIMEIF